MFTPGSGAPLPPAPVYPAAEAQAAVAAVEALVDALAALSTVQEDLTAALLTSGFSGSFRQHFATAHETDLAAVERWWKGGAGALEADLATLRRELERFEADVAAHGDLIAARAAVAPRAQ